MRSMVVTDDLPVVLHGVTIFWPVLSSVVVTFEPGSQSFVLGALFITYMTRKKMMLD